MVDIIEVFFVLIGRIIFFVSKLGYIFLGIGFVVGINIIVINNYVVESFKNVKVLNLNVKDDVWFYLGWDGSVILFGKFKVIDVVFFLNVDIVVVIVGK